MVYLIACIITLVNLMVFLVLIIEFGKRKNDEFEVVTPKQAARKKRKIDIFVAHFLTKK